MDWKHIKKFNKNEMGYHFIGLNDLNPVDFFKNYRGPSVGTIWTKYF